MRTRQGFQVGIYVPTEYATTHRQFLAAESSTEVLIAGQSDVKACLAPPLIDRAAFNYSDTGESPIESYFKLRYHLPRMPKLRILLYSLAIASFVGVRTQRLYSRMYRRGYIRPSDYPALRELGVRNPAVEHITSMLKFTGKPELAQTVTNAWRAVRRQPPLPPLKGELLRGFRYIEGSRVEADRAADMARHHFAGHDPCDPLLIGYFEKILQLCKEQGITVIAVSAPVTDLYLKAAAEYVTWDEVLAATVHNPRFEGLLDGHIDMTHMFEDRYELFRDQNHMNVLGAQEASRHVAAVLGDRVRPELSELPAPRR